MTDTPAERPHPPDDPATARPEPIDREAPGAFVDDDDGPLPEPNEPA